MTRGRKSACALIGLALVAVLAWPVYAHCGRCASSVKDMLKTMDEGKVTLGKAIEAAEQHCKGKAVSAFSELDDGKLVINVYCLAGDKIMKVDVDGKSGKAGASAEAKHIPDPEEEVHGKTKE